MEALEDGSVWAEAKRGPRDAGEGDGCDDDVGVESRAVWAKRKEVPLDVGVGGTSKDGDCDGLGGAEVSRCTVGDGEGATRGAGKRGGVGRGWLQSMSSRSSSSSAAASRSEKHRFLPAMPEGTEGKRVGAWQEKSGGGREGGSGASPCECPCGFCGGVGSCVMSTSSSGSAFTSGGADGAGARVRRLFWAGFRNAFPCSSSKPRRD